MLDNAKRLWTQLRKESRGFFENLDARVEDLMTGRIPGAKITREALLAHLCKQIDNRARAVGNILQTDNYYLLCSAERDTNRRMKLLEMLPREDAVQALRDYADEHKYETPYQMMVFWLFTTDRSELGRLGIDLDKDLQNGSIAIYSASQPTQEPTLVQPVGAFQIRDRSGTVKTVEVTREGRIGLFRATRPVNNDIWIDSDRRVSDVHASFRVSGERVYLKDEGSTNGTCINGSELAAQSEQELAFGDIVTLSPDTSLVFVALSATNVQHRWVCQQGPLALQGNELLATAGRNGDIPIGRAPDGNYPESISLSIADPTIAATHAWIRLRDGLPSIEAAASHAVVHVDGRALTIGELRPLPNGAYIQCGPAVLRYTRE